MKTVGGSSAFPTKTVLGGFREAPSRDKLFRSRDSIFEVLDEAQDLVNLFSTFEMSNLRVDTRLAALSSPEKSYPLYPGDFPEEIKELIIKNSTAKLGVLREGEVIKVGALARLSHSPELLNPKAKDFFF